MTDRLSIYEGRKILRHDALEKEVQSVIVEYLESHKIHFSITDAGESFSDGGNRIQRVYPAGCSDLIVLTPNAKYLALEVKRAIGGVLSFEQAEFLKSALRSGGLICVARSVDDVIEVLMKGVRQCDLDEMEKALAKGPDVKGLLRRRERNTRRRFERRRSVA